MHLLIIFNAGSWLPGGEEVGWLNPDLEEGRIIRGDKTASLCVSDNSVRAQGSRVHCCRRGLRRPLQVTVDPAGRDPGSSVSLGSGDTYRLFHLTMTNALTVFSSSSVTSPKEDQSLKHVIRLNKKRLESRRPLLSGRNAIKL